MKFAIVGGGSAYVPHLMHNLIARADRLYFDEIVLIDANETRLNIMADYCRRLTDGAGINTKIGRTTDLGAGVAGAKIVLSTIRPGGNELRALDERVAIENKVFGQETNGPAGFAFALRTVLPSIEIGKAVEEFAPDAYLLSTTNPAGIMTQAISTHTKAKVIGLCHGGISLEDHIAKNILDLEDSSRVKILYAGLNHLGVVYKVFVNGKEVPEEIMAGKLAEYNEKQPDSDRLEPEFIKLWKWPYFVGLYWHYWFHTDRMFRLHKNQEKVRGEEVKDLEAPLFEALQTANCWDDLPMSIRARGSTEVERKEMAQHAMAGYIRGVLAAMDGLINDTGEILALNVLNKGAIDDIDDDASVELSGIITSNGFRPFRVGKLPLETRGMMLATKAYETLTVKAAVEGSYELALKALMSHPLVRQYELAKKLLDRYLIVDKEYLPQFK